MRNYLLICFLFLFLFACNNEQETVQATNLQTPVEEEAVASKIIDIAPQATVIGEDTLTVEKAIPVSDQKTLVGIKQRTETSKVKNEKCCESPEQMQDCCCDEIIQKYKEYLTEENIDEAIDLKSKDPFYLACQKQRKNFDSSIEKVDKNFFGE